MADLEAVEPHLPAQAPRAHRPAKRSELETTTEERTPTAKRTTAPWGSGGSAPSPACEKSRICALCRHETSNFERVTGIEPALSAWEADVLPLNYTRERHHCTRWAAPDSSRHRQRTR